MDEMPFGTPAGSSKFSDRFGMVTMSPDGLTFTEIAHMDRRGFAALDETFELEQHRAPQRVALLQIAPAASRHA
ncbi:hypothetical protein [Mesorhizobium sp.]|uniref:hypothetical protein n=1 Tax=Mesorhizobium sp. TaxID=1871066 RepID=UPI00257F80FD|nr:hypothetical protein [Mesorhizobium sp.]